MIVIMSCFGFLIWLLCEYFPVCAIFSVSNYASLSRLIFHAYIAIAVTISIDILKF